MKSKLGAIALAVAALGAGADSYRAALPGYRYEFPRDHFNHPNYQTEWWYYTGNLRSADGHRYGFELTFFRHGENRQATKPGVWDIRDVWLAHLALSDIDGGRFFHSERMNRAGPGLAGAELSAARVWNGNWQARWQLDPESQGGVRAIDLDGVDARFSLRLSLRPLKAPVIHGIDGVSQKGAGRGQASHYISYTRLRAQGEVAVEGKSIAVEGLAWMDHEFFTHQLGQDLAGWDWFSLQFDDGAELMVFRLRRKDGTGDPYSAGTYIDPQGLARHLRYRDFSLTPGETWTSAATGGKYPVAWSVRVPSCRIEASIRTRLPQQELTGKASYWEGAIEVGGSRPGVGYLEMTGYAGPVNIGE